MSTQFMQELRKSADDQNNISITENGAIAKKTTGRALLDMNFRVTSYRDGNHDPVGDWTAAWNEDNLLALKWLFYARDIRGGLGERDLFTKVFDYAATNIYGVDDLIQLIPEYGRWKDLLSITGQSRKKVYELFGEQIKKDLELMKKNQPISLAAKWLPSENASSLGSKKMAREIARHLGMSFRNYRKTCSSLRKYLGDSIVEVKASANKWGDIDYQRVPSKANILYKDAFEKHDSARRQEYLSKVLSGQAKINAGALFPHDIVTRYQGMGSDDSLEALWKALPNEPIENTLVVADGSGSMTSCLKGTNTSAWDVAHALAIYFSERNSGEYKNNYITFSSRPQFVDLSKATTLGQKIKICQRHNECSNTDIEAVFGLILNTAIAKGLSQDDLPRNILVISDMEFDGCTGRPNHNLFDHICDQYKAAGFQMPKLIFWNVCGRTDSIPVTENAAGVALVSGFAIATVKMAMTNKLDPYEALKEILNGDRYKAVRLTC